MFLPTWGQASCKPGGSTDKLGTVQSKRSSCVTIQSKTATHSTALYHRKQELITQQAQVRLQANRRLEEELLTAFYRCLCLYVALQPASILFFAQNLWRHTVECCTGCYAREGPLPMCTLLKLPPTHPLGDAQRAQAFHGVEVEVILRFTPDLFLMPSSGVI